MTINQKRHLLSMIVAVIISIFLGYFFASAYLILVPLSALFVMQTEIGNSLYQGILRGMLLLLILACTSLIIFSQAFFYLLSHDIALGIIIGILVNSAIFPRRVALEFQEQVIPVINAGQAYFSMIMQLVYQEKNVQLSNHFEASICQLPDWVYGRGFDTGLQKGHRFFLLKIEQMSDVLFAMHYLAAEGFYSEAVSGLKKSLIIWQEHILHLFSLISTALALKKVEKGLEDISKQLAELDNQLIDIIPFQNPLNLDLKQIRFEEFVLNIKELNNILLKLAEALR